MQLRPGGPVPACVPNVGPGWTQGSVASPQMGQRMPHHLPPKMPPNQVPNPGMVPSLSGSPAAFNKGLVAAGGNGTTGDGVASSATGAPQVAALKLHVQ